MSSGCASETSSNAGEGSNGFDADYPDGGTIKRKPQQQQQQQQQQPQQQQQQQHPQQQQQQPHKSEVTEAVVEVSNTIRRRQNAFQQVTFATKS